MAEETTKIVRMQQRRGQKQDLPKPLRPGEIGFATDSRQMYIGADTSDPVSDIYNKTGIFEKTASAQSTTTGIANIQMVKFTVPHKIYDKGFFDGVANVVSWTPATMVATSGTTVGREGRVFGDVTAGSSFINNITGTAFIPADVKVVKNGVTIVPSATASISSSEDYFFEQSSTSQSLSSHTHTLTLRTPPSGSEEISLSYYSNAAVINAIENANVGLTNKQGFYTAKGIEEYRQISTDNIRVADGIGIGFIGLQFKHIQVATDVKHIPSEADFSNTLGTLYLTKKDTVREAVAGVTDADSITLTGNLVAGSYSLDSVGANPLAGVYTHAYIKGGSGWFQDGKVVAVTTYDSANATLNATLPSNAASITRKVSSVADASGNINITVENVENTQTVDSVRFIDTGSNLSGLHNAVYSISDDAGSINSTSKTIKLDGAYNAAMNSDTNNLFFITYKVEDQSNVIVTSPRHGNLQSDNVVFVNTGAANPTGSKTIGAVTGNTFVLTTSSNITANVADLTIKPVVANATVEATPVVSVGLSTASTPASVQTLVNGKNLWPKIASIPGAANKMYITHAEAVQKVPFTFALHEDETGTLSALGFRDGEYDRPNATVKAKLEDWLDDIYTSTEVNIFKKIYVNAEFNSQYASTGTPRFAVWDLNLNSSLGEMSFEERTEARDFAKILNNLYFESVNPDIRGLMNIKTNIEFLTTEALASGTAKTTFSSPEQLSIPSGSNQAVSELNIDFASGDGQVNTQFVEYSMSATTGSGNYRRVGSLMYSGDATINDMVLTDTYSDARSGSLTGNVIFSAEMSGSTGTVKVDNSLSPATPVTVRYVVRRWPD